MRKLLSLHPRLLCRLVLVGFGGCKHWSESRPTLTMVCRMVTLIVADYLGFITR